MGKLTLYFHRGISKITSKFYPNVTGSSFVDHRAVVYNNNNLIMEERTNIDGHATIMNTRAKFIMKKNSGAAFGLTVITGGHLSVPGMWLKDVTDAIKDEMDPDHQEDRDIVVEEDVWLGANVTLLKGVHVGRGSVVGAGSVVRNDIPPYAVVTGNPAKIVGFKYSPSIIVEHEEKLFPEEERLSEELLEENYKKYFISRIKEIQEYLK